ncbi:hypothetical protein PACTADRAFT_1161 [Pachysolen tannophilus NRRL Y-2460]|uniref:Protein phosphatase n=1 Tax=Pachysolen tannophilus NRRL Y-2460 TaxID=669874 RepID=A0A1E4TXX8_PACTA|nr:hypothetical protein PACTADRAFT_1161 [Pachysolen tannophilus NRRL Y-2460]
MNIINKSNLQLPKFFHRTRTISTNSSYRISSLLQNYNTSAQFLVTDNDIGNGEVSTAIDATKRSSTSSRPLSFENYFKFEYANSNYVHHGKPGRHLPMVSSLSDLSDSTQIAALMPARRPIGSPTDTISIRSGDDALLCSRYFLGVADGISSWGENKDAGLWARSMLEAMSRNLTFYERKILSQNRSINDEEIEMLLDDSYMRTVQLMRDEGLEGSSTILLCIILDHNLKIVNIGDSKFYMFRDGKIIKTNKEQMKSILCPEQLGTNDKIDELPSSKAIFDSEELKENDILVICSDGLSDNLWQDEIELYVNKIIFQEGKTLQELANFLLKKAKNVAFDNYAVCPYVEKINSLPFEIRKSYITGGKVDDISVCVAKVLKN